MEPTSCNLYNPSKRQCKQHCRAHDTKEYTCCLMCTEKKGCKYMCQMARPIPRKKKVFDNIVTGLEEAIEHVKKEKKKKI